MKCSKLISCKDFVVFAIFRFNVSNVKNNKYQVHFCANVCIRVRVCSCSCVRMRVCVRACVCVYVCVCLYVCPCVSVGACTTCVRACVPVCTRARIINK